MWKLFVVPVCSKSWIAAAKTIARISSSLSQCCVEMHRHASLSGFGGNIGSLLGALPWVRCVASGSGQSAWRLRRGSGCGTGSCIYCIQSRVLRQTAPEPEPGSENTEPQIVKGKSIKQNTAEQLTYIRRSRAIPLVTYWLLENTCQYGQHNFICLLVFIAIAVICAGEYPSVR